MQLTLHANGSLKSNARHFCFLLTKYTATQKATSDAKLLPRARCNNVAGSDGGCASGAAKAVQDARWPQGCVDERDQTS